MQRMDLRSPPRTWVVGAGGFAGDQAEEWFSQECLAAVAQRTDRDRLPAIDDVFDQDSGMGRGKGRKQDG